MVGICIPRYLMEFALHLKGKFVWHRVLVSSGKDTLRASDLSKLILRLDRFSKRDRSLRRLGIER